MKKITNAQDAIGHFVKLAHDLRDTVDDLDNLLPPGANGEHPFTESTYQMVREAFEQAEQASKLLVGEYTADLWGQKQQARQQLQGNAYAGYSG